MAEDSLPISSADSDSTLIGPKLGDTEGSRFTAPAPPFCPPIAPAIPEALMGLPVTGQRLDDFELLRLIGTGSFAKVFLAHQVSLDRQVALKVSLNRGHEARTLASLEHDHIVRVFSEVVDSERDLRMLCMQYVPGTTLERIIESLGVRDPAGARPPTGEAILHVVDEQVSDPAALDLAALRDRELLSSLDAIEAGCWMGARLAEALAHAHELGVLHRDVKPANILVNRYGRPLLVDFNVSSMARAGDDGDPVGGTLAYMAPEHLEAFIENVTGIVDARSDVYALGVVLYELFSGRRPFPAVKADRLPDLVRQLVEQRRAGAPLLPDEVNAPPSLQRLIARCLAPRPQDRFQSAAELAVALRSCLELRRAQRDMPPGRLLTRWALRMPFLTAALLMTLPHFLASIINISYNSQRIVLTGEQRRAFGEVLLLYNAIAYPLGLFLLFRQVVPVFRTWRRLARPGPVDPEQVNDARLKALSLPRWGIVLSCLAWLPGGVIFPLGMDVLTGEMKPRTYGQFVFSFTVSGLIALTWSVIAVEFIVVRVLYPGLWLDARRMSQTARLELGREEGRMAVLQFLAVLVPLAGASLLLSVGENDFTLEMRLLVLALLAVGMLGLGLAILAGSELRRTVAALTGSARRSTAGSLRH
jgi:serine/threonine protein kinase